MVVTGATGYLGRALIGALGERGHDVVAVVRPGASARAPAVGRVVEANVLDGADFARVLERGDTVVHLVGTPRPSPAKAAAFRAVDLPSIVAATTAAASGGASHLVYVSVAHPSPVMRDYIAVRMEGERLVRASGVPATILRPWYVLGPGHWWPYALLPLYALARALPSRREAAHRLGLVTHAEMRAALVSSVEQPPRRGEVRVLDVPAIRAAGR